MEKSAKRGRSKLRTLSNCAHCGIHKWANFITMAYAPRPLEQCSSAVLYFNDFAGAGRPFALRSYSCNCYCCICCCCFFFVSSTYYLHWSQFGLRSLLWPPLPRVLYTSSHEYHAHLTAIEWQSNRSDRSVRFEVPWRRFRSRKSNASAANRSAAGNGHPLWAV